MSSNPLTLELAQTMCEYFECILTKSFYALYGSRTDLDGLTVERFHRSAVEITLEGNVLWLQGDGLGHCFKIDLGIMPSPLLYSFKFYDFSDTMRQTIYIAKSGKDWFVAESHDFSAPPWLCIKKPSQLENPLRQENERR